MNYYTEGDTIEVVSLDGTNTERANTRIGARYRVEQVYLYSNVVKVGFNSFLDFKDIKVVQRAPVTDEVTEQLVAQKAVYAYREAMEAKQEQEALLQEKNDYWIGDFVTIKVFNGFTSVPTVAMVIGYEKEYDSYRLLMSNMHQTSRLAQGMDFTDVRLGDLSEEFLNYDPMEVTEITVNLKEETL